jgi:hypothetical protein
VTIRRILSIILMLTVGGVVGCGSGTPTTPPVTIGEGGNPAGGALPGKTNKPGPPAPPPIQPVTK